jgi:hypothetical protein
MAGSVRARVKHVVEAAMGVADTLEFVQDFMAGLRAEARLMLANALFWAFRNPASYF